MQQGLAALRATGAELRVPLFLGAAGRGLCARVARRKKGLRVLAEALAMVEKNEERWNEAELCRLKGELTLQQGGGAEKSKGKNKIQSQTKIPNPQTEAEACFLKAIEVSQKQQAKLLELRATVSLEARLWQQQAQEKNDAKHIPCCPTSTTGSRKDLKRRICKRRRRCSIV